MRYITVQKKNISRSYSVAFLIHLIDSFSFSGKTDLQVIVPVDRYTFSLKCPQVIMINGHGKTDSGRGRSPASRPKLRASCARPQHALQAPFGHISVRISSVTNTRSPKSSWSVFARSSGGPTWGIPACSISAARSDRPSSRQGYLRMPSATSVSRPFDATTAFSLIARRRGRAGAMQRSRSWCSSEKSRSWRTVRSSCPTSSWRTVAPPCAVTPPRPAVRRRLVAHRHPAAHRGPIVYRNFALHRIQTNLSFS